MKNITNIGLLLLSGVAVSCGSLDREPVEVNSYVYSVDWEQDGVGANAAITGGDVTGGCLDDNVLTRACEPLSVYYTVEDSDGEEVTSGVALFEFVYEEDAIGPWTEADGDETKRVLATEPLQLEIDTVRPGEPYQILLSSTDTEDNAILNGSLRPVDGE